MGGKLTKSIRAKVVVAVHAVEVRAVDGRVAGHVLWLLALLLLLLLPAAAEHLVEETELGVGDGGEQGEEEDM